MIRTDEIDFALLLDGQEVDDHLNSIRLHHRLEVLCKRPCARTVSYTNTKKGSKEERKKASKKEERAEM